MIKRIGVCGAQRAGKDTFAKILTNLYPNKFKTCAFGDMLKEEASAFIPKEEIGWTGKDWSGPKTEKGRKFLQEYGNGKRKNNWNYWIDKVRETSKKWPDMCTIVSDTRYFNECEFCLEQGIMVYIYNEKMEKAFIEDTKQRGGEAHISESQWRLWIASNPFNYKLVQNNGTIKDFENSILRSIQIIITKDEV